MIHEAEFHRRLSEQQKLESTSMDSLCRCLRFQATLINYPVIESIAQPSKTKPPVA